MRAKVPKKAPIRTSPMIRMPMPATVGGRTGKVGISTGARTKLRAKAIENRMRLGTNPELNPGIKAIAVPRRAKIRKKPNRFRERISSSMKYQPRETMRLYSCWVNSFSVVIMNGKKKIKAPKITRILGTNVNVIS